MSERGRKVTANLDCGCRLIVFPERRDSFGFPKIGRRDLCQRTHHANAAGESTYVVFARWWLFYLVPSCRPLVPSPGSPLACYSPKATKPQQEAGRGFFTWAGSARQGVRHHLVLLP